jgi:hypothetical protein
MARQPFFTGNYGSALAQVDTRPIMEGARAQAEMYQNLGQSLGQNIGGAIEKYGLNKEKAETADMMIGAYLENMSPVDRGELEAGTSEIGKTLNKFIDGELTTSKKVAFAGVLGVMQTQREKDARRDLMKAQEAYYRQPRHAPPNPKDLAMSELIKEAKRSMDSSIRGGGKRGSGRGAKAPPGSPGVPGPGTGSQPRPPGLNALIASGTQRALGATPGGGPQQPLPPQTGAAGQAMAAPPPPGGKRKGKYKNLSRPERKLMRWSDQNPGAAAVLNEEVYGGGIKELRDRSREWGRNEIGVAQEVLDKDGLATDLYLIPTSNNTQLVQSAPEAKPKLYDVKTLENGSRQQYMGNGKWFELKIDEFDTKRDAEADVQRLADSGISAKASFNKTTGGFNVEVTEGATRAFVEVEDPDFKGRIMYHPDTKQFWTKGKNDKMRPMVEDAVTVIGQDESDDDIVVLNGGSTPYIRNDYGLTPIPLKDLRPEAHMSLLGTSFRTKSAYPGLKNYMEAQRQARADGLRGAWGTGLKDLDSNGKEKIGKTKYYYETEANEVISVTKSKEMEDIIEEIKKIGGDMTALRLLHSLPTP